MGNEILSLELSNDHKYTFGYKICDEVLILSFKNANKKIRMHFFEILFFKYELSTSADKLIELEGDTPLFKEIMNKNYGIPTAVYPYRHYQIVDVDGFPKIEIIALPLDVYVEP